MVTCIRTALKRGVLALSLFALSFASVEAQTATTGAVTGTVTDSAQAAIPNTSVILVSAATGVPQTVTTGTNGAFGFNQLAPGNYTIRFSAPGYKGTQPAPLTVNISEALAVDAKLEPGAPGETVACACAVRTAASSSNGTLVDSKTITSVPLTSRNFTQVLSMSAGSAASVNNAGLLGRTNQSVNVNGNTTAGSFTINGAYASSTVPNPDTISEFKIQTSQYDAGYGAQVPNTNVLTKAGTNELHGSLWEFNRNDIFNANEYFRKSAGQKKPNLKQNQFGVAVGGPILKSRLLFFFSYQGTRQTNGLDPTSLSTMFLPPLTDDRSRATLGRQFCPALNGAAYQTFAGGTQVACDGSNISPVALNILNAKLPDGSGYFIPTPQTIVNGLGFSSYSFPSTYRENQYIGNLDYVISKNHTLSERLFTSTVNQYRSFGGPVNSGNPFTPGGPQTLQANDYVNSVKLTSLFAKNISNEARVDYTKSTTLAAGPGIPTASSLGITPVDKFFDRPSEITINGSLGAFRFFGNASNDFSSDNVTYQVSDNVSWVKGRQSLRAGLFGFTQLAQRLDTGAARGRITFQNFTDLLIGQDAATNGSPKGFSNVRSVSASEGVGPNGEARYQSRWYSLAAFLEDDVKFTSRLTLNFGLRWEYITPTKDTDGVTGNFFPFLANQVRIPPAGGTYAGISLPANYNPSLINPYTGQPFGPPPPGVDIHGTNTMYRNRTPLDTFSPRFGFAWQPGRAQRKLTVNGGYGWNYQTGPTGGNASGSPLYTPQPFTQGFNNSDASNAAANVQKPFPTPTLGFQLRTRTSALADRVAGPEYKLQLVQQWNVNVQYELVKSLSLNMGYVGSYGNHLLLEQKLNQPLLASPSNPVNCGYDGDPTHCITVNTRQNAAQRVPILGELPTALGTSSFSGESAYHGLQATLREQLSHGLTAQLSYTFSKAENNTTVYNDQYNLALDWARSNFDRTHRLTTNFNYQFPESQRRGLLAAATRGWSSSGLIIVQSGTPLTLTDIAGGTVYGSAGISTITTCSGNVQGIATPGSPRDRLNNYFNTSRFCPAPAIGADGSTGYGNTGQGILNGPGQVNTDFSFGKQTHIGPAERVSDLAFRVEFYNAFNHSQFSNPGTAFGTASFGKITQTSVAPRLIQFGLKYIF